MRHTFLHPSNHSEHIITCCSSAVLRGRKLKHTEHQQKQHEAKCAEICCTFDKLVILATSLTTLPDLLCDDAVTTSSDKGAYDTGFDNEARHYRASGVCLSKAQSPCQREHQETECT